MGLRAPGFAGTRSPFSVDHSFLGKLRFICFSWAYCALGVVVTEKVLGNDAPILNLTVRDGLRAPQASFLQRDHDGNLWFLSGGEIHRYDGSNMSTWTGKLSLQRDDPIKILRRDPQGVMWMVSEANVIYRHDGRTLTHVFTATEGQSISSLDLDSDRTLWFGMSAAGLFRYDGTSTIPYSANRGLPVASSYHVVRTQDGELWVGLGAGHQPTGGLFRWKGEGFDHGSTVGGLDDFDVHGMGPLVHSGFWAATSRGLIHYDGKSFQRFSVADGFPDNRVLTGFVSSDGRLWCGTESGVAQFDGIAWASLDARDGLGGKSINSIAEDDERDIWFATDSGLSRYRRDSKSPTVRIRSVHARGNDRFAASQITGIGVPITFSFDSADTKTVLEKRLYRCRIVKGTLSAEDLDPGPDSPEHTLWLAPSRSNSFVWTPVTAGAFTFGVQAIDRDLVYSKPAAFVFTVVQPWYFSRQFVGFVLGGFLALFVGRWALSAGRWPLKRRA